MKSVLNPLIELVATNMMRVDQYPDVFERLAGSRRCRPLLRRLCRRHLADDLAAAPLLFIHVPKNGGTSVKRALYSSEPGHASVRYYDLFFPQWFAQTPSLAILRDPVDRFLSGFDFLMNGGGGDVRIQRKPLRRMRHIRSVDALLDHLEAARRSDDWLAVDTFLRPQSWFVTDARGVIRIDHLWLLDRAEDGLAAFLRDKGVAELPHKNRTRRTVRELGDAQAERLHRLYADDFALYEHVRAAGGYSGSLTGVPVSALNFASTSSSIAS